MNINWNALGAGPHTLRVFADGVEFASVRVIVRPIVKGRLETPSAGSDESGIGLIGGWVCDAENVSILIDGFPSFDAIYGGPRGDTRSECGDDANGFGLVMNWGLLGDGQHSLRVFADGVQFGSATFNIKTFGVPFFRHGPANFTLSGFPDATKDTIISWSQAHQKFITSGIISTSGAPVVEPPPVVDPPNNPDPVAPPVDSSRASLELPQQQAILSGKGSVKGWVCDATLIEASLDDQPGKVPLNYPLSRPDTTAICGDDDNGFELSDIDWVSLGEGSHTLHFFADGVEFSSVNVTIQSTSEAPLITAKQGITAAA
ncbi:MAG: hypothetical protein KAG66_15025, partial [Methylococcales bacterium]|nr:hypothetical protein [Methylococcales bacterium]